MRRFGAVILAVAFLAAACSGGDGIDETTTSAGATTVATTVPDATPASTTSTTAPGDTTSTEATTTTTTVPAGPPLAREGDNNDSVASIQFLLNCNGYGELKVDGAFGPGTLAAVEKAQQGLGLTVDGVPGEATVTALSRGCTDIRDVADAGNGVGIAGNAAPDDPSVYTMALLAGTEVAVDFTRGTGLVASLTAADGSAVASPGDATWTIGTTRDYLLKVTAPSDPTTFVLDLVVTGTEPDTGDWVLAGNGISYDGDKLAIGDGAGGVIEDVFDYLGHGIRGAYDEFDTDWYATEGDTPIGLRGLFTEGLAFLFFATDPDDPAATGTLFRVRYLGNSIDAAGEPRPDGYVTTGEGVTVGDTLTDLRAAYGDRLQSGSNDDEHYRRITDSGGELCFYFGASDPTEFSVITEISTECRD